MAATIPGREGGKRRLNADINVVPYIDVMLVLLIIFMVTAPLLTQGVDVELPETEATVLPQDEEPMTLTVTRKGELTLNFGEKQRQPLPDDEVLRIASAVAKAKPDKIVLVEGDKKVPYEFVAKGMSILQQAGIKKIGFVTDPISVPASDDDQKK